MSILYALGQKFVHTNVTTRGINASSLWRATQMFLHTREFKVPYLHGNLVGMSVWVIADEEENVPAT